MANETFQLVLRKGPRPGQVYPLDLDTLSVGRDPLSDIVLDDPEISRHHARLTFTDDGYTLQDLGSTNGSFVDGKRLGGEAVHLKPGQVIMLGSNVTLIYQAISDVDPLATMVAPAVMPGVVAPKSPVVKPVVAEPVVEEMAIEEPVVEEPAIEEPVFEEPIFEEPVFEEPVFEEPLFEEPIFEEPVIEELVIEEPAEAFELPEELEVDEEDFELATMMEESPFAAAARVTEPEPEPLPAFEEPEPLPAFEEPEPLPAFEEPEPLPAFEEPEPLPAFEEPEPLPAFEEPEPFPAFKQPEPMATMVEPPPAPVEKPKQEPLPAFKEPEPLPFADEVKPPAPAFSAMDTQAMFDSGEPIARYDRQPVAVPTPQPPAEVDKVGKKSSTNRNLIIAVVAIVLLCCCLLIIVLVALAATGTFASADVAPIIGLATSVAGISG